MTNMNAALMDFIASLKRVHSENGQTLAEYSLIVTLVAVGVTVAALLFFRAALAGTYTSVAGCLLGAC